MKKWKFICNLFICLSLFLFNAPAFASTLNSTVKSFEASSLIKSDSSYWVWGNGDASPIQIHGLLDVEKSFGSQLVMKKDYSVWFWEWTNRSVAAQVYNIKALSNLVDVKSDWNNILALDQKGKIYLLSTQGRLDSNQFNQINPLSSIENVQDISWYYEYDTQQYMEPRWIFLKKDETVWINKGKFPSVAFEPIQSLENVIDIEQNIALKKDGTVWSWTNKKGSKPSEPYTATPINELTKIQTVKSYGKSVVAIDQNSSLWFWGVTVTGVSDGTTEHYQSVPIKLTSIKDVKDAVVVERSIVVLTNNGDVYITSIDRETMPGNPIFEYLMSDVQQIKAGYRCVIIRKNDSSLWGWGINKNGQLGCGDFEFMHNTPQLMQKPVSVYLNNKAIVLNSGIIIRNGQAFIPLRSVFEKMGAVVKWDVYNKTVNISKNKVDNQPVNISINYTSKEVFIDKKQVLLSNRPFILSTTAYLPLRFISESLGAKVVWLQNDDKILISMQ